MDRDYVITLRAPAVTACSTASVPRAGRFLPPRDRLLHQADQPDPGREDGQGPARPGAIHAEDVKEYLIASGIPTDQIAIKTSSQNDIEDVDLLSTACPIRFIVTKQALQEGWDCPFAYLLTALSASKSRTALTQLVGRVLRQPYARKTGVRDLDESYVYCLRDSSKNLVEVIREGFELDGLGDLFDRMTPSKSAEGGLGRRKRQEVRRAEFERSLHEFLLPTFVTRDGRGGSRELDFSIDIQPEIDYRKLDLSRLNDVYLDEKKRRRETVTAFNFAATVASDREELLAMRQKEENPLAGEELHASYFVRNILDLVPNPWVAKQVVDRTITLLDTRFGREKLIQNQVQALEEVRRILAGDDERPGEVSRLARKVFLEKLRRDDIRFVLRYDADAVLKRESYYESQGRESFSLSLFEPIIRGSMNNFERQFATELEDKADRTFWWYRNKSTPRDGYRLVGWQRGRFYPDFIFTIRGSSPDRFERIFVVETKGAHLGRTEDTRYKRELVKEYNDHFTSIKEPWGALEQLRFADLKRVTFELMTEGEWKSEMNRLMN